MPALIFAPSARQDLLDIFDYIARDKPTAAANWIDKIEEKCGLIATMPAMGEKRPEYGIDFLGVAYCFRLSDGEQVYRERLDISGSGDKIYASLVAGDGKLYGVSRLDGTVVLALSPEFRLLAHNRLGDESVFNATPAIADDQLLLRSDRFLYCLSTSAE